MNAPSKAFELLQGRTEGTVLSDVNGHLWTVFGCILHGAVMSQVVAAVIRFTCQRVRGRVRVRGMGRVRVYLFGGCASVRRTLHVYAP